MGVTELVFAVELQKVRQLHFLQFLREDWDEFQIGIYKKGRRKH